MIKGKKLWISVGIAAGLLAAGLGAWHFLGGGGRTIAEPVTEAEMGAIAWDISPRLMAMCQASPSDLPAHLEKWHREDRFIEYWRKAKEKPDVAPPAIDAALPLDSLSLPDLILARAFVEARNGVVLMDPDKRAFFEQFDWYQPVWAEGFKPQYAPDEVQWKKRLDAEIAKCHADDHVVVGGLKRSRLDHVVNRYQFRDLDQEVLRQLDTAGFSIVEGTDPQLWNMQDRNEYELVPTFVTTDLYLQLMRMRFKMLLKDLETRHLTTLLGRTLAGLREANRKRLDEATIPATKAASAWLDAYLAVAAGLAQGATSVEVAGEWSVAAQAEFAGASRAQGEGSQLLGEPRFDFTQMKPRGHYDRNDTLRAYFRAVRWLGEARIKTVDPVRFGAMALLASDLSANPERAQELSAWEQVVGAFAGPDNGLSLRQILSESQGKDLEALVADPAGLASLAKQVAAKDPARIKARASNATLQAEVAQPTVRLLPRRWSADGEMLQRLVELSPAPGPRPFPTAMDLWAVQGIAQADTILFQEEGQAKLWPAYPDSLAAVRKTFEKGIPGDDFHAKRMRLLRTIFDLPKGTVPDFLATPLWQRKNLLTATAAWTIQKQEVLLYQEQPVGAECGGGGQDEPPPPEPKGYVEPVPHFWRGAAAVLDDVDDLLARLDLADESVTSTNAEIRKDLLWLAECSEKELAGKALSPEDHSRLMFLGGAVESQTMMVTGMDKLAFDQSEEKHMGSVVDVYTNGKVLLEATGPASVIWAIVPIEGELRLVRGAIFSHREWKDAKRLTDKEWHEMIENGQMPPRSRWQDRIHAPVKKTISLPLSTSDC
ncbi:MAG: hypothetical protein RL318_400 [Fibrobacterota bacterium]